MGDTHAILANKTLVSNPYVVPHPFRLRTLQTLSRMLKPKCEYDNVDKIR